ncbi:hypothetical protein ACJ41O_003007 [Fusarium nematophilum]
MPCVRGVDVSIITQPGSKKLPEFPHSDASSVRILPPGNHRSNLSETVSVSSAPDSPRIQKVNPRISVYVPSVPGAQFGVHYSLTRMPEPPCHVYFKIFMNGRNVTNCGTNPALQASGSITRALCEPSERWHYKENGMIHKREGIESRCFYFLPNSSKTSVAEDGGLIEVQAFRAQGRKRRAPILGKHRDQESYGIATPSAGLVESLEDACYYDWILIDPKEYPFVSFHFHYRSWSNLRQLNLAPAFSELKEPALQVGDSFPGTSSNSAALCNGVIGNELIEASPIKIEYASDRRQVYQEEELSHFEQHRPPSGRHSAAEAPEVARIRVSARPLPEVPLKKPSVKKSCESFARSITPSLLPYIEEEPTEVEEVEFGTHHTDATAMADSGWLRILGANRSRTHGLSSPRSEPALQDLLKSSHGSTEMQTHHERKSMTRLVSCQGSALAEQVTSSFAPELAFDEVDKLFINAGQQVWHSPSIDQVAEALRVGVMTNPSQEPLPVEYRPYILYLVEGYGTIHQKVTKLEAEVAGAKYQLDKESERHAAVEERWMVQEARYKAEIKRLELIIHDISGESLEAVVLARAGSLVRGRTKVPAEQKERPVDDAVDDSSVRSSRANTATQDEDTDRPSPPSLKSQQGTILSRRRTMDTSNEVRLSRRFRKLDNIVQKPDTHGTRRVKKQEAVRGKTHEEQDRTAQPSRRDTSSLSGSKSSGAVGEPPLKGNEEKKRDSAEMPASKDTVHGPCSRSAAAESKSMHDGQQTYGHHRRQFSFVPGDDRAAVRPTETMAPRSTAAVAQVGQQLPVLGRHPNRCPGKNWRSRSAEWIGMGEGLRPITTDTHGATEMGDGPRK